MLETTILSLWITPKSYCCSFVSHHLTPQKQHHQIAEPRETLASTSLEIRNSILNQIKEHILVLKLLTQSQTKIESILQRKFTQSTHPLVQFKTIRCPGRRAE
ncbi:hypothetical protein Droror1_Dr00027881 [Drosera rotundifolia]